MFATLALLCAMIVAVSLLGGMLPLTMVLNHTRLQAYLSFAAGSMLGAAFFHMLPESARMGSPGTIRWAAVGLLSLFLLERFFSFHHHETSKVTNDLEPEAAGHADHHSHAHAHSELPATELTVESLSWGTATFGLGIHTLVGGVALGSAIAADFVERKGIGPTGWGVFIATMLHKPADALTIVSLMLRSGVPKRLVHVVNLGFALMIPVGVSVFLLGMGNLSPQTASLGTAAALAFSAGTFLCIALSDLLPELQFHSHDRLQLSLALLAGFGLMAGSSAIELLQSP